jgi:multiple sugar transport system substrate-binding protein
MIRSRHRSHLPGYRLGHHRRASAALLATGLALTAAACSGSGGSGSGAGGRTTITVNCMPPKSAKVDRKSFQDDIAAFEKANPSIHVVAHDAFPCSDPKTFDAKLAGGQMENVFYVYFTDVQKVITRRQAADITRYTAHVPGYHDLQPSVTSIFTSRGRVYGLPRTNYSMGLLYNRALFRRAGLDPDAPPTTWAELRADARKIAALGHGTVGYADYSAGNQGGWHFTAEMYAQGGSVVSPDGRHATVDTPQGRAVLENLRRMRWDDGSMGSRQLLQITDVQQMMGAGRLGMYLSAPDNVPIIVKQYQGSYGDLAMAPMPGGHGTLLGGDGYMFGTKDSPAQIRAGLKWLEFENLTPGSGLNDWKRAAALKAPVGLPQPDLWTGATARKDNALKARYANVPVRNYRRFLDAGGRISGRLEPPKAQQIYSVLDGVMSGVLTDRHADLGRLLADANRKIDQLLARQD